MVFSPARKDADCVEAKAIGRSYTPGRTFPVELLRLITSHLDITTTKSFAQASKLFANVAKRRLWRTINTVQPHALEAEALEDYRLNHWRISESRIFVDHEEAGRRLRYVRDTISEIGSGGVRAISTGSYNGYWMDVIMLMRSCAETIHEWYFTAFADDCNPERPCHRRIWLSNWSVNLPNLHILSLNLAASGRYLPLDMYGCLLSHVPSVETLNITMHCGPDYMDVFAISCWCCGESENTKPLASIDELEAMRRLNVRITLDPRDASDLPDLGTLIEKCPNLEALDLNIRVGDEGVYGTYHLPFAYNAVNLEWLSLSGDVWCMEDLRFGDELQMFPDLRIFLEPDQNYERAHTYFEMIHVPEHPSLQHYLARSKEYKSDESDYIEGRLPLEDRSTLNDPIIDSHIPRNLSITPSLVRRLQSAPCLTTVQFCVDPNTDRDLAHPNEWAEQGYRGSVIRSYRHGSEEAFHLTNLHGTLQCLPWNPDDPALPFDLRTPHIGACGCAVCEEEQDLYERYTARIGGDIHERRSGYEQHSAYIGYPKMLPNGMERLYHVYDAGRSRWDHATDYRGCTVPLEIFEKMRTVDGKSKEEWDARGVEVGAEAWEILTKWKREKEDREWKGAIWWSMYKREIGDKPRGW